MLFGGNVCYSSSIMAYNLKYGVKKSAIKQHLIMLIKKKMLKFFKAENSTFEVSEFNSSLFTLHYMQTYLSNLKLIIMKLLDLC